MRFIILGRMQYIKASFSSSFRISKNYIYGRAPHRDKYLYFIIYKCGFIQMLFCYAITRCCKFPSNQTTQPKSPFYRLYYYTSLLKFHVSIIYLPNYSLAAVSHVHSHLKHKRYNDDISEFSLL